MPFCVRTIDHEPRLCADGGLLRSDFLAMTADAREAAARIRDDAKREADQVLEHARAEAEAIVAASGKEVMERAAGLLQALERQHATFAEHAQDLLLDLSQAVYDRLVVETTDRERIAGCIRRILRETPDGLVNTALRVHPDDIPLLPPVDWVVKPDGGMQRGTCCLEASSGEWHADFSAAVDALRDAMAGLRYVRSAGVEQAASAKG